MNQAIVSYESRNRVIHIFSLDLIFSLIILILRLKFYVKNERLINFLSKEIVLKHSDVLIFKIKNINVGDINNSSIIVSDNFFSETFPYLK